MPWGRHSHAPAEKRRPRWSRYRTKRGAVTILGALLVVAFLIGGLAQVRLETSVESFLPHDDPALQELQAAASDFGGDPVVVLLESRQPGELLDQQHLLPLLQLEGQLSRLPDVAATYGPATTLNQIAGRVQDLLAELAGRRDALRARGGDATAAEFDARYGALLVQGLPAGLPTLRNPGFVETVLHTPDGQPKPQWRFMVPSDRAVAVLIRPREGLDQDGTDRLVQSVRNAVSAARDTVGAERAIVSGVPTVTSDLASQVRWEIPVIGGIAVVAVAACFLLIPWTRGVRRRLLPVVTTTVAVALTVATFGWLDRPLSLGVVAFLPVLLGIGSYYPTYFAQHARRRVVLVVASATAAAFATLALSPLPLVRDLGLTLAFGVLLAAALGMVLVRAVSRADAEPRGDRRPATRTAASWPIRAAAALLAVAVAATGWVMLPQLRLDSDFRNFAAGLETLEDARKVESVIGSSGEVAVVLRGPDVLAPQAVSWSHSAQSMIVERHGDQLRPVISPATLLPFLGSSPSAAQIEAATRLLPPYLTGSVFRDDRRAAVLSFGVRMDDLDQLRTLRDDVARNLPPPPTGYRVELTGLPMAAVRGHELVSSDRVITNVAGILAAGGVLLIGLRRRSDAARAVAAATLATGVGLAALWVARVPLTPITAALGSLTAAVGCEFTVLLAEAVRRGNAALRTSVLLATATSAVGYAVLAVSQLEAVREFGLLLAASVLLALGAAACVVWLTVKPLRRSDRRPATATTPPVSVTTPGGGS
ncbi:RND transporter [Prauserella sp. PE36]|uniref:RND transporter n=3 Tax=Pseudonocardiaceae TaxID=2070 RepID=A0A2V4ADJ8_9PSEU|nr:RND transporter [Amycolatopsis albispora]PXY17394.1 RND transporter [Prauserella muralis]PXY18355.1 RND transporter [Prauserella coralliicola]PXY25689.1 RND transporter [Prauserella flavalba]RBM20593.1 RND transporter [Prauserella sp. PE36]